MGTTSCDAVSGMPLVDNCMQGYASTIMAYGQTGAGKTFTMLGQLARLDGAPSEQVGCTPPDAFAISALALHLLMLICCCSGAWVPVCLSTCFS